MTSSFLLERAAKMKQNEADLINIASGLVDAPGELLTVIPAKRARAPAQKKEPRSFAPVRKSSRVAGLAISEEQLEISRAEEEEVEREEWQRLRVLKHASRDLNVLRSIKGSGSVEECRDVMNTLIPVKMAVKGEEDDKSAVAIQDADTQIKSKRNQRSSLSTTIDDPSPSRQSDLMDVLSKCQLRSIVTVNPERIYSLIVHPSVARDIVFAGDKWGNISLWDCTEASEKIAKRGANDDVDLEAKGKLFVWNQHGKHSVPCLRINPTNPSSIYSAAYDCTVRQLNFETGTSSEVINGDAFEDELLMHGIDITHDGNSIWACDNGVTDASFFTHLYSGGIIHRDLRSPLSTAKRWTIDRFKVGSVSLNPVDNNFIVTAHLKRDMKLWDLRKLVGGKGTASVDTALRGQFAHGQACSSAYFSPSGNQILSTSYDDKMRIWNVDRASLGNIIEDFNPSYEHKHNNQVGRYVSVFKAQWSPAPDLEPHFTTGNMKHPLDVISGRGKVLAQLTDEHVTAVPAVTASHPVIGGRYYGGTASGKVSIFAPGDGDDTKEEDENKPLFNTT